MKRSYFGNNLQVLLESINSESVDLGYLDLSLGDITFKRAEKESIATGFNKQK